MKQGNHKNKKESTVPIFLILSDFIRISERSPVKQVKANKVAKTKKKKKEKKSNV